MREGVQTILLPVSRGAAGRVGVSHCVCSGSIFGYVCTLSAAQRAHRRSPSSFLPPVTSAAAGSVAGIV